MNQSRIAIALPLVMLGVAAAPAWADDTSPAPQSLAPSRLMAQAPGSSGGPLDVSPNPNNNTTGDQTGRDIPEALSQPPRVGLFPGFGQSLLSHGIDVHGVIFDHFLANPSSGVKTGNTSNMAQIDPAIDFDLEKLIGLPGGNIHVRDTNYVFKSYLPQIVYATGGVINGYQTTPSQAKNLLSVLTYEQRLFNDRLSVEVGRTNVYNYFFLSNSLDPFSYVSSTVSTDGDFNSQPFPVWGGRATYKLTPAYYIQLGAFEDSFQRTAINGQNFGVSKATGAQLIAELGYRTDFSNAAYPANFEVAVDWNTRTGPGNLKEIPALYTPRNGARPYDGGGFLYAQGQQVVWRGVSIPNGPPANIGVFGSVAAAVDKPQPIDMDALLGVNFTGLIPGRPFDALGVEARYQRLSAVEANFETLVANLRAGRGPSQSRDSFEFELVGNVQVTPAVSLRPIVEYFVTPDAYNRGPAVGRPQSGFQAGVYGVVALGQLLGTSQKPF